MNNIIKYNKTKIIATIGPATSSVEMLIKIIEAGVNVCRLNFSHGDHATHKKVIENIREANRRLGTYVAILADLQGPKLRIGDVQNNRMNLVEGNVVTLTTKKVESSGDLIHVRYTTLARDVKMGERVLLDDGKLELEFTERIDEETVKAKVLVGGILSSNKGFNLPSSTLSVECLTPKDLVDLEFAIKHNVDWVALSFVREASDIEKLRNILNENNSEAKIVAKIEKPQAVDNFDSILEATDAIMVARGDLGVEMPMEQVPIIQKRIVSKCIEATKPVIIATQMMES